MPAFGSRNVPVRSGEFPIEWNNPPGHPSAYPEGTTWWTGLRHESAYRWPPAVTRASSLIVNPLCRLPWIVRKPDGTAVEPDTQDYPAWLTDPALINGSSGGSNLGVFDQLDRPTRFDFFGNWVRDALLRGTGLMAYTPTPDGPKAGTFLNLDPGRLYKGDEGYQLDVGGVMEPVSPEGTVAGQRLVVLRHSLKGGVLGWHRDQIRLAQRMQEYAEETFTESGVPTGVISTEQALSQEDVDETREEWLKRQRSRTLAILDNGAKYSAVAISPVDSELVSMSKLSNEQIAHAFEFSAWHLDAADNTMTYANAGQYARELVTGPLSSWSARIEQTVGALLPWGWRIEIDFGQYTKSQAVPAPANNNAADNPQPVEPEEAPNEPR